MKKYDEAEHLALSFVVFLQLNRSHSGIVSTFGTIHRFVVARALVEFLNGSSVVALLKVRLAHDMVDLVDLLVSQVA